MLDFILTLILISFVVLIITDLMIPRKSKLSESDRSFLRGMDEL